MLKVPKLERTFVILDIFWSPGGQDFGKDSHGGDSGHCSWSFYVCSCSISHSHLLTKPVTGVSTGILLASNGSTIDSWTVGGDKAQLQVYVAVIEMIINFLILFALAEGIVIRFWRQLLHGTTVSLVLFTCY
jgi:hypothetical protein